MKRPKNLNLKNATKLELMSYGRRIAYLKRCISVIGLLKQYESDTSVRCRVFEKHIEPIMCISYQTFNSMLNEINPEKQLIEIDEKIKLLKKPSVEKVDKTHSIPQHVQIIDRVVPVDGGW